MNDSLKKFLKPVASLRLTVVLLFLVMLVVYVGTSAQKEAGIWEVQHQFFHSWICVAPLKYLLPLSDWWWTHAPGGTIAIGTSIHIPIGLPLLGGYSLILLLLVNLLAAHAVRFKFVLGDLLLLPTLAAAMAFVWGAEQSPSFVTIAGAAFFIVAALGLCGFFHGKRTGVIVIHFGLILLLAGEIITTRFAVESQMPLDNGATTSWSQDVRAYELAVTDPSDPDHDTVTVVPTDLLATGKTIEDQRLPFEIKVVKYFPNSQLLGPMQSHVNAENLATAGVGKQLYVRPMAVYPGTKAEDVNMPAAFLALSADGKPLGTYLVTLGLDDMLGGRAQTVDVDGKPYQISLRFKRIYHPYTVHLDHFTHSVYAGTDIASKFASQVTIVNTQTGEERHANIHMNSPMRYHGETFYQSSFKPNDQGTVLQVVYNPAWLLPYCAVLIGAIGLVIHFGIVLFNFIRRTIRENEAASLPSRLPPPGASSARRGGAAGGGAYTLKPRRSWNTIGAAIGAGSTALAAICYFSIAATPPSTGVYDLNDFARLPAFVEGRAMPLDSLARNTLKIIHTSESVAVAGPNGQTHTISAIEWLADMLGRPGQAAEYKIFRVDHPDVKGLLGLNDSEKYFSWNDIFGVPGNGAKLQKQYDSAHAVEEKNRDAYQTKLVELYDHATTYLRLMRAADAVQIYSMFTDSDAGARFLADAHAAEAVPEAQRTSEQKLLLDRYDSVEDTLKHFLHMPDSQDAAHRKDAEDFVRKMDLLLIAPEVKGSDAWVGLGHTALAAEDPARYGQPTPNAQAVMRILLDYRDGHSEAFNSDLRAYQRTVEQVLPGQSAKASYEVLFNRISPFFLCGMLYVAIFLVICAYWLTGAKPLVWGALAALFLVWLIHSFGLVSRIYISGRPPVINLYSSALFIGWVGVMLCLGAELLFRNSMATAVATVIGSVPLLIAGGLSTLDADTMGQLQAVLNTNGWLATHVVVVTMGYAATLLAGVLAIGYVLANLVLTPARGGLDADTRKVMARMAYGILCFGLLFSFVGTILGGIWADQSWGRFWGWDPKENGAILIVLWNALILHARWSGLIRDRGVMALALVGNIVVGWSWFGTNMLGIGLHSYGFMSSAFNWLTAWVVLQLVLLGASTFIRPIGARR